MKEKDYRAMLQQKRFEGMNRKQLLAENVCPDCHELFIRTMVPNERYEIQCRCGFRCTRDEYHDAISTRHYDETDTDSAEE